MSLAALLWAVSPLPRFGHAVAVVYIFAPSRCRFLDGNGRLRDDWPQQARALAEHPTSTPQGQKARSPLYVCLAACVAMLLTRDVRVLHS
jgi:hypothetical protein